MDITSRLHSLPQPRGARAPHSAFYCIWPYMAQPHLTMARVLAVAATLFVVLPPEAALGKRIAAEQPDALAAQGSPLLLHGVASHVDLAAAAIAARPAARQIAELGRNTLHRALEVGKRRGVGPGGFDRGSKIHAHWRNLAHTWSISAAGT